MGLRDFLEEVPSVCTDDTVLAKRIAKDMLLKYDYELADADSCFAMTTSDFTEPLQRIEILFLSKYIDRVDTEKMQRAEDLVYLLSLYSYQAKYETDNYTKEIETITAKIKETPVKEVDSLISMDVVAKGFWSD